MFLSLAFMDDLLRRADDERSLLLEPSSHTERESVDSLPVTEPHPAFSAELFRVRITGSFP